MTPGIDLLITERSGIFRWNEPITMGVPFEKGQAHGDPAFLLFDESGNPVPVQTEALSRWSDGSIRWLLLDFQANASENTSAKWEFRLREEGRSPVPVSPIKTHVSENSITVDTGAAVFCVDTRCFRPFTSVKMDGAEYISSENSATVLRGGAGQLFFPFIKSWRFETQGPLRTTIFMSGIFRQQDMKKGESSGLSDFFARIHFYAGHRLTKVEFSIRNPRAAKHPGGIWDLGDKNSIFFKDLAVTVGINPPLHSFREGTGDLNTAWKILPGGKMEQAPQKAKEIVIYQDSSGGENWRSRNYVNKDSVVTTSFRGYRVYEDGKIIENGERANPVVSIGNGGKVVSATLPGFWQNFPKALEARSDSLSIRLFPGQYSGLFELQGGEQKTHTFFLSFGRADNGPLEWTHAQLVPRLKPEYYEKTDVLPRLTPDKSDCHSEYSGLMQGIIEGENSFFNRREIIDEYGWRNFGDLYADHENAYYNGQKPVISHYNNQYDAIHGFLLQYAKSGDPRWFELADDLARHVMDIDIYHTEQDKAAYNGGLFWHTDHYADAATSTHRTYSAKTMRAKGLKHYGGGPSNEHDYTSGLLEYYFMTGNYMAMETVTGLADWVINMDDGRKNPLRFLSRGATGLASQTGAADYHNPGRGCGNSINALLDGFILTNDKKYLDKAEELIRRCINPNDDIESLDLVKDPERRWYYTAFLQILGRYLDFKSERAEYDHMFCYAEESLLNYAGWMAKNEVPFKQMLGVVEYPTETWIVMDMRKSNVFNFAAKYETDDGRRRQFISKAGFFYNTCLKDLEEFETKTLTRPLVMLMSYGIISGYFTRETVGRTEDGGGQQYEFGPPQRFVPQRARAKRRLLAAGMLCCITVLVFLVRWLFLN